MIIYSFKDLEIISSMLNQNEFYSLFAPLTHLEKACSFDEVWNRFISLNFPEETLQVLDAYKSELIMSLYSTLLYESLPAKSFEQMFIEYAKTDPILHDETISKIKSEGKRKAKELQPLADLCSDPQNPDLPSRTRVFYQYLDTTPLLYLLQYQNPNAKVLNSPDYIRYLNDFKRWPCYPTNLCGMRFSKYFELIKHFQLEDAASIKEYVSDEDSWFDEEFSAYIMEQLFHPTQFIHHIEKNLAECGADFKKENSPLRSQLLCLSRPLFALPPLLLSQFEDTYYKKMKKYLRDGSDEALNDFASLIKDALYYQTCLQPYLQVLLFECLKRLYAHPLVSAVADIKKYIIDNQSDFCYSFDIIARSNINPVCYPKSESSIFRDANASKGKNTAEAYELSATYQLLIQPPILNFFQRNFLNGNHIDREQFLLLEARKILHPASAITNSRTPLTPFTSEQLKTLL